MGMYQFCRPLDPRSSPNCRGQEPPSANDPQSLPDRRGPLQGAQDLPHSPNSPERRRWFLASPFNDSYPEQGPWWTPQDLPTPAAALQEGAVA
jgi:hypothetical protein